jgi:hypothetical protein
MEKTFNIGIDIGKHGAICIVNNKLNTSTVEPIPMIGTELDYQTLHNILEPYEGGNGVVVFEKLGVIFGTSKATAFSMGHQAGAIEMICVARSIPFTKVPPKVWQKEMFIGITEITKPSKSGKTTVRDTKAMALLAIKQLFPNQKLTFGKQATKPHDGLIDAVLMAEYGRRKL